MNTRELLALSPIVPVMVIDDAAAAVDLAQALVAGGIYALEITLRTPAALPAMRRIRDAVPQAVVGAGTITQPLQVQQCIDAGAQFGVSPGLTPALANAVQSAALPFLPGVASASELMAAQAAGFDTFKLFPAEAVGGIKLLQALACLLPTPASAPPAASPRPTRPITWPCPMYWPWAALGSPPKPPWPPKIGRKSPA